jgi:hypothetical protein
VFESCLDAGKDAEVGGANPTTSLHENIHDLVALMDIEHAPVGSDSWLTGSLIDYVFTKFARCYPSVHFLSTTFAHFDMPNLARMISSGQHRSVREHVATDVLGRAVSLNSDNSLIFFWNIGNMHWNLFRVTLFPQPELQLFEPMG